MRKFEGWFAEMRRSPAFRREYEGHIQACRAEGTAPESPKSWAHGRFEAMASAGRAVASREAEKVRRRAREVTSAIVKYEDYPT